MKGIVSRAAKTTASAAVSAPAFAHPRLTREWRTMAAMVQIFCRDQHHSSSQALCAECNQLLNYAAARLTRCPFSAEKPTCAHCPVHCYAPARREQVRAVMRYAGPRMVWRHPILSFWHMLDGFRKPAQSPGKPGAIPPFT